MHSRERALVKGHVLCVMRGLTLATCLPLAALAFLAGGSHVTFSPPTGDSSLPTAGYAMPADEPQRPEKDNKLAVVVPAYNGDLDRAVASLGRWPTDCSSLTVQNVDLVLYYAEGEEDSEAVGAAAEVIAATAGRCFADVRTVYAHLEQEVRAYWSFCSRDPQTSCHGTKRERKIIHGDRRKFIAHMCRLGRPQQQFELSEENKHNGRRGRCGLFFLARRHRVDDNMHRRYRKWLPEKMMR